MAYRANQLRNPGLTGASAGWIVGLAWSDDGRLAADSLKADAGTANGRVMLLGSADPSKIKDPGVGHLSTWVKESAQTRRRPAPSASHDGPAPLLEGALHPGTRPCHSVPATPDSSHLGAACLVGTLGRVTCSSVDVADVAHGDRGTRELGGRTMMEKVTISIGLTVDGFVGCIVGLWLGWRLTLWIGEWLLQAGRLSVLRVPSGRTSAARRHFRLSAKTFCLLRAFWGAPQSQKV